MTVDTTKVALVFAGQGESNFANTAELLNDYFKIDADTDADYDGEEIEFGGVYFVLTESQPSKGLDSLFDWADWLGLPYWLIVPDGYKENRYNKAYFKYADQVLDANEIVSETMEAIPSDLDPFFVFAWGDEPSEEDFDLLEEVGAANFKAVDITAGLDDLILEPENEPEPEPEPEPEEKPKRGRARASAKKDEEPEAERKPAPRTRKKPEPKEEPEDEKVEESLKALESGETTGVVMKRVNKENLLAAFDNMRSLVVALVEALPDDMELELNVPYRVPSVPQIEVETPTKDIPESSAHSTEDVESPEKPADPPKRGRGRPRNPNPKPVKEYLQDDGEWVRAGRGRPPADVEIRWVNPETGEEVDAPK